ncbi:MAG: alpha/beta hydrolase [Proteobacteria bacterium]|nr:alpha/beta hydrolase [Pseudomonadota bacterium]
MLRLGRFTYVSAGIALAACGATAALAQDSSEVFAEIESRYRTLTNRTYLVADGIELKLDAIVPRVAESPVPTLVSFHGGGWISGSKELSYLRVLTYLEAGYAVVTANYRLVARARAPAAVEDVRCVLRWVFANAGEWNFDVERIVLTGWSAGGHLALMAGLVASTDGFDTRCPAASRAVFADDREMPVRAIVNWFGPSDIPDVLTGPNARSVTATWIGGEPGADDLARRVSPMNYLREDSPPIITIHGDADRVVPYEQSTRLHRALDELGVANRLVTIGGGGHGAFTAEENLRARSAIREFLEVHVPPDL